MSAIRTRQQQQQEENNCKQNENIIYGHKNLYCQKYIYDPLRHRSGMAVQYIKWFHKKIYKKCQITGKFIDIIIAKEGVNVMF